LQFIIVIISPLPPPLEKLLRLHNHKNAFYCCAPPRVSPRPGGDVNNLIHSCIIIFGALLLLETILNINRDPLAASAEACALHICFACSQPQISIAASN